MKYTIVYTNGVFNEGVEEYEAKTLSAAKRYASRHSIGGYDTVLFEGGWYEYNQKIAIRRWNHHSATFSPWENC